LHKVKPQTDKTMRETLFSNYAVSEERTADGYFWEGIKLKDSVVYENIAGNKNV